jgi:hypothetical protein
VIIYALKSCILLIPAAIHYKLTMPYPPRGLSSWYGKIHLWAYQLFRMYEHQNSRAGPAIDLQGAFRTVRRRSSTKPMLVPGQAFRW